MNKKFYIIIIGLFLINCTSNTIIKKPENLIPKSQMVDILTDMFLASGAENIKNIQLQRNVNYFPIVYEKYHIDSTQFKESNFYYVSRIDDYEEILRKVDERLQKLKKLNEAEIFLLDSIKKIDKNLQKVDEEEQEE